MKIRIVSKRPPQTESSAGGARINGIISAWPEVTVYQQHDDGTETEIQNVMSVSWSAEAGPEISVCTLKLFDVEIDAEADVFPGQVGGVHAGEP